MMHYDELLNATKKCRDEARTIASEMADHAEEITLLAKRIASCEEASLLERRRIFNILGWDENGAGLEITAEDGETRITLDPYYALEAAIIDLERTGADPVSIATIRDIQGRLAEVASIAKFTDQGEQAMDELVAIGQEIDRE